MRKDAEAHARASRTAGAAADKIKDVALGVADAMGGALTFTRRVGGSLAASTLELARWGRLTAVFSGLIGAGGLYGLNTLAAGVAMRRRDAAGLGISIGEGSAFRTNFGRLGNVDGVLQGFSAAAANPNQRMALASLGVDPHGKDAAQLFAEALPKLKRILEGADRNNLSGVTRSLGLSELGIDDTMARLIRDMQWSEVGDIERNYATDVPALGIPDDAAQAWQDFSAQLTRAGTQIETTIAGSLVNIEPGLEKLSRSFVDLVEHLTREGGAVSQWLNDLGGAMQWWSDYFTSQDFADHVTQFLKHAEHIEHVIGRVVLGSPLSPTQPAARVTGQNAPQADTSVDSGTGTHGVDAAPQGDSRGWGERGVRSGGRFDHPDASSPAATLPSRAKSGHPDASSPAATLPDRAATGSADDSFLDPRSRRELSGVNNDLARALVEASNESGIRFKVLQGRRTQEEANANAASGRGVRNSQHLYGAAADVRMIDPATGQPTQDRAIYEQFADHFRKISEKEGHPNQRWLGALPGRWGSDIAHFDQGIGYGQSHEADPYGRAAPPTKDDVKAANQDIYRSDANPFTRHHAAVPLQHPNSRPARSPSVVVNDQTGGASMVEVSGP